MALLICVLLANTITAKAAMFTPQTYPRVDGATIAIPLGKLIAEKLIGKEQLIGSNGVNVTAFKSTHNAYINLITKKADIIFVFEPSEEELKLAAEHNVQLKLTPIGKDAFVFLVNQKNPVNGLTIQQIQDIYSGNMHNWSEVGGNDQDIIAYQRNKNSGSQTFMEQKVMANIPLADTPKISSTMYDVVDEIHHVPNAIGYSFYYFVNGMYNPGGQIKFLSLNGQECSKENIRNGKYLLTATLYAVTRADSKDSDSVSKMLTWLLSNEGISVIEEGGFVSLK